MKHQEYIRIVDKRQIPPQTFIFSKSFIKSLKVPAPPTQKEMKE